MRVEHKLKVLNCFYISKELADGLACEPFEETRTDVGEKVANPYSQASFRVGKRLVVGVVFVGEENDEVSDFNC